MRLLRSARNDTIGAQRAVPLQAAKTPHELTIPTPCLGPQQNEYVLKDILGMSDDEVADLLISGALE